MHFTKLCTSVCPWYTVSEIQSIHVILSNALSHTYLAHELESDMIVIMVMTIVVVIIHNYYYYYCYLLLLLLLLLSSSSSSSLMS